MADIPIAMLSNVRIMVPVLRHRSVSTRCSNIPSSNLNASSSRVLASLQKDKNSVSVHDINTRLNDLHLTASYLSGVPLAQLEIRLPTVLERTSLDCPTSELSHKTLVVPEASEKVIEAPTSIVDKVIEAPTAPGGDVVKYAHRMLRIRKRKMKVHRRRRRRIRDKARMQKVYANRKRTKEIAFRKDLMVRIKTAKKFSANTYVEDKLSTYSQELTPLTYKGKRLPQWLIKELIIKDRLTAEDDKLRRLDLDTREALIKDGETVEQFKERIAKRYKK